MELSANAVSSFNVKEAAVGYVNCRNSHRLEPLKICLLQSYLCNFYFGSISVQQSGVINTELQEVHHEILWCFQMNIYLHGKLVFLNIPN